MPKAPGRICLFIHDLTGGGAERSTLDLTVAFRERGYDVDLFVFSADGPYRRDVPIDIRVIESGIHGHKLTTIIALARFVRYLGRYKPDAVISALMTPNLVAILAKLLTRTKARCIVIVRDVRDVSKQFESAGYGSATRSIIRWMLIQLARHADKIVAVSDGLADCVRNNWPCPREKVIRIYNPVYSERIAAKCREKVDEEIFDSRSVPTVITVGRLDPLKNQAMLIHAIRRIRATRPVRLVILGDGELRLALQDLASSLGLRDYVHVLGFKSNPFAYISQADVFALSSDLESFSRVLVEAMACGCPVVSTDCPFGPREILEDGKWGKLVPIGNEEAMAEAILETIDHPISPDVLVSRAKCFSIERSADEYERVIWGRGLATCPPK